ncbi:gamma-glutamylcyclotransferase family protein [Flavobacterium aestuarii]|uniref:gamma-glutamylcyclotransferase family protein n=1 Tax=Flavobacterium aestuarii TaxID=3149227 RepID=UPI0032B40BD6
MLSFSPDGSGILCSRGSGTQIQRTAGRLFLKMYNLFAPEKSKAQLIINDITFPKIESMQKLFAYGTLQDVDVQQDLFGRILEGTPETLVGYELNEIQIEEEFGIVHYPIIMETQDSNDTISGTLYIVTQSELRQADLYEGLHYKRVEVHLQSNQNAWAYSAAI